MSQTLRKPFYSFGYGAVDSPRGGFRRQPADSLAELRNCIISPEGIIGPRYGSTAMNLAVVNGGSAVGLTGSECWGMDRFFSASDGGEIFIEVVGQKAYKSTDYGVTWTAIAAATGLTEFPWSFATMTVAGVTYLLGCNGTNFVSYDGATWSAITAPVAPHYLAQHHARIWMGRGDSEVLYASALNDFTDWTFPNALQLPINTNDGQPISGMISGGTALLVFKPSSASLVPGFGDSDVVVAAGASGLSGSFGCVAHRTIVRAGDSIMWLSRRGVESWTEGRGVKLVSNPIFFTIEQSTFLMRTRPLFGMIPWACYDDRLQSYRLFTSTWAGERDLATDISYFIVTDTGLKIKAVHSSGLSDVGFGDVAYRMLPLHGGWSTDTYNAPAGLTSGGWMAGMIAGTDEGKFALYGAVRGLGYVFREDASAAGDYVLANGALTYRASIDQRIKTPVFDMGAGSKRKRLRKVALVGGMGGSTPATFDFTVEGDVQRDAVAGAPVTHAGLEWSDESATAMVLHRVMTSCRGANFQITIEKTITGAPGTAGAGIYLRSLEAEGTLIEGAI